MNLKEIREEINSALDYNPDLKQYSDNIARVVNRHYLQISSQYQWLFMQNRNLLQLRADITGDSASKLTGDNTHLVTLPRTTGAGIINLPPDIVGKTLVNNDDGAEYRITAFIDSRRFFVDDIFPSGDLTNWTIKYKKYPMPRDCIEVLGIMDRGITTKETLSFSSDSTTTTMTAPNEGRFMFLDARKEENLYLDRSDTGNPFVSVEEIHDNIQSPDYPPTIVNRIKTGVGNLPLVVAPYRIEYCYTFIYAGMEGPPSEVVAVDLNPSQFPSKESFGTDSSLLDVVLIGDPGRPPNIELRRIMRTVSHNLSEADNNGRMKKLYRRIVFSDEYLSHPGATNYVMGAGAWRHIATLASLETTYTDYGNEITGAETVEDPLDSGSPGDSAVDLAGDTFRLDRLNESGPRQYLRFWNTPKSDYMVEVRYHKRPYRLVKDADAPEWPPQYHHYLVYAALRDICMQHGMLNHSQLYEGRADEILAAMKAKYLSRTDRMYVRRGFDRAMADRERFGIPSKAE